LIENKKLAAKIGRLSIGTTAQKCTNLSQMTTPPRHTDARQNRCQQRDLGDRSAVKNCYRKPGGRHALPQNDTAVGQPDCSAHA
jgi:hypothetical protein